MKNKIFALILFLSALATAVFSQTRSEVIETSSAGKYYIHTVQAKETFYGLSRLYSVSIDEIQFCNNNLKSLSPGQKIKIPYVESYTDGQIIAKNGQSYIVHQVKAKETLYGLSQQYETSAGQILAANPSMSGSSLQLNQMIFIPISSKIVNNQSKQKTVQPTQTAVQTPSQTQNSVPTQTVTEVPNVSMLDYQMSKDMSLHALALQLRIPYEVIRQCNPTIDENLTVGTILKIPHDKVFFQKSFVYAWSGNSSAIEMSQKYSVSSYELLHYNAYGMTHFDEGTYIKIPINNDNLSLAQSQIDEKKFIFHQVEQGETAYSIQRKYQTTESEIVAQNPSIDLTNLPIGAVLAIPYNKAIYEYIVIPEAEEISADSLNIIRPEINVTMLLPFFLDRNTQPSDETIINKPKEIYEHTYQFLEYYEGALLALDSLRKLGISVTLDVIESNNDSATANINKIKIRTDLIIGPVFTKTFPMAAGFAKRRNIPIVSPLSTEETNVNNPFVIQMNTPQKYRFDAMVDYIIANNSNCHVCIVYNNEKLEKKNMLQCKDAFTKKKTHLDAKNISFGEIYYPNSGSSMIENAFAKKEQTVVIVLSKQQAFANNIVTKLYQSSKAHHIELWGMSQWERYENLELDFLFDLNFKCVINGNIDYTSPAVNSFITKYREIYNTEPTKTSFQGYDQMLYFAKILASSSNAINVLKNTTPTTGLHEQFQFAKKDGAITNTSSFIVIYDKETSTRKTIPYTVSE